MRRQTLVFVPVALLVTAVLLGIALFVRGSARAARDPKGARVVAFGSARLPLPAAFRPSATRTHQAWSVQEFQARGVGTLQLASEPLDGVPFEAACRRFFDLPAWPSEPLSYRARGREWFFKPLPLFRQGALSLHKEGKSLRMVACFDQGTHRHWVELITTQGFRPEQEVFDALVLSLQAVDGTAPGARLRSALAAVPGETRHRFLLPLEVLALLPVVILLLPTLILWGVGRRSGRLPEAPSMAAQAAFCRPFLEVSLVGNGQWKFMLACVAAGNGELVVHTFGTPLLRIPRAALAGRTRTVHGWLNPPYLELPLDPPAEFLKRRWLYGLASGRFKLRIYTAELDALRVALGV